MAGETAENLNFKLFGYIFERVRSSASIRLYSGECSNLEEK